MIVDSSAVLAIFFQEPEARHFAALLAKPGPKRMSAANYLECAIRLDNWVDGASIDLDAFLEETRIELVAVTPAHARIARLAHRRFGRGRHPAGLNFGDCFAYALAKDSGEPLLHKRRDFARTDLAGPP